MLGRALISITVFLTSLSAQTYPSTPFYSNVGLLRCGIRLIAADQVQTWCYLVTGSGNVLVHNTLNPIRLGSVRRLTVVEGNDHIEWVVSWLDGAIPLKYQINTSVDGWQQGVLGDLDPTMPDRPVVAGSNCLYFCCASPDPFISRWLARGTPLPAGLAVRHAVARICQP